MKITDEAVHAAQAEYRRQAEKYNWYSWPSEESMRSIVTAAFPHLPAGYKVKQQAREERMKIGSFILNHRERRRKLTVEAGGDTIDIQIEEENFGEEPDRDADFYLTPNEAIALGEWLLSVAQADFERRVRECIDSTLANEGAKMNTKELIQALSRLAGNRHFDGVSSLVSAGDRSTIINTCHDLIIALKTSDTVDVAAVRRKALEEAANICDQSAALSQEQHDKAESHSYIKATLKGEVVAAKVLSGRIRALSAAPTEEEAK